MIKKIFLTIGATLSAVALALYLFLNTILNAFGLVATSIEQMADLRNSQQVVEKMRDRNAQKRKSIHKKFSKKAGKKLATTAVAATTVGTVAVVGVTSYFLVGDYCEERKDLHEQDNLLSGTNEPFNWQSCWEEGQEDIKLAANELKKSSSDAVSEAMKGAADFSSEKWNQMKEATDAAMQSTSDGATEFWNDIKSWFSD